MDAIPFALPAFYVAAFGFGLLGQALRGVLGLLKRYRELGGFGFSPVFFAMTMTMGGIAGLLGALVYDLGAVSPVEVPLSAVLADRNFILMAISAGYFGTDVIEGVLGRYTPQRPDRRDNSRLLPN